MHYSDEEQIKKEILKLVVYKHGVLGKEPKYNKKCLLKEESVHYDITSIQQCEFFSPSLLQRIIAKPYQMLNSYMSEKPFESWYELTIREKDWNVIEIIKCEVVDEHPDDIKRLH